LAGRESYLSDGGLAWPWLVITMAVLYAVRLVYFALVGQPRADRTSSLDAVTAALFTFLVFAIRDTLVFQWYLLTRVRQPTMYGVAALVLYYAGSALVLAISGGPDGLVMPVLLTPVASLARQDDVPGALYVGLAFQMALIGALLVAIHARLGRGDKLAAS
jgi:hypothetical protein